MKTDVSTTTETTIGNDALSALRVSPARTKSEEILLPPQREPGAKPPVSPASPIPKTNRRRNIVLASALLLVSAAAATYYVIEVAPYESTDDAAIEAHVTAIGPQAAGRVAKLLVTDNQAVKRGQVLLQIDPSDYAAALAQARAAVAAAASRLEQAKAQSSVDEARVGQEKANVVAAEAEATRAEADLKRYQAVGSLGVSESQLDLASAQARSTSAAVAAAREKLAAAQAQALLAQASIRTAAAETEKNDAAVRQAELNLSYTEVKAPEDGYITHRTVEAGAYVQIGQPLLALVPHQVWVVANYKETQLRQMRPGQPVEVRVDAYPQLKLKGHVDSIQSGAGARFSLFPPENASGNYVKVVQRVPVKIVLEGTPDSPYVLGPGMSVETNVRIK